VLSYHGTTHQNEIHSMLPCQDCTLKSVASLHQKGKGTAFTFCAKKRKRFQIGLKRSLELLLLTSGHKGAIRNNEPHQFIIKLILMALVFAPVVPRWNQNKRERERGQSPKECSGSTCMVSGACFLIRCPSIVVVAHINTAAA
jgi:hypothetical protein